MQESPPPIIQPFSIHHPCNYQLTSPNHAPDNPHQLTNHELINLSRTASWSKAYQLVTPQTEHSFFHAPSDATSSKDPSSAQHTWDKFNPQKQPIFELDIFKMMRDGKQTANSTELAIEQPLHAQVETQPLQKENIIIQTKKPPPFMGAFSHVQPNFNFFNLNISLPSSQQYKPFSCFYHDEVEDNSRVEGEYLEVSKISAIKDIQPHNNAKYFFEIDSAQSDISDIVEHHEIIDKGNKIEQPEEKSLLWNYAVLFEQRPNFKHRDPMWEEASMQKQPRQSRVFQVMKESSLRVLHEMQLELNLAEEMKEVIPDEYILSEASKILQNVECDIFSLDYAKMEWSLDLTQFRLEHSFKNSLRHRVKDLLVIANYRSRIDVALHYIRKRPFRRVYYQLGVQITEIQILFESIILHEAKNCSLIEFLLRVDKLKLEMSLIYKLLINQCYVMDDKRSYEDFDYRYLNSQYVIFKQVVKQSKMADSLNSEVKPMLTTLLVAVFKPITTILNGLLFQQCMAIELNDEIYLKYYFDNHKDILNFLSKKIALIKQESHQLYQVCRIREQIEVILGLKELEEYQHRWEKVFGRKRKLIERIRRNYKLKLKSERERRHQERMRVIYSLKSRIYQQQEEENARKKMISIKNREQLERLKKEIDARQERRKLLEMLEKEKQRGLMLDIQLQEKQRLQKEKDALLKKINAVEQKEDQGDKEKKSEQNITDKIHKIQEESPPPAQSIPQEKKPSIKEQKPAEPHSQDHIKSANSIQSNKMVFTADNFLQKRHSSKLSNNKTESYFRLAPKNSPSLQPDSPSDSDYSMQMEELSQSEEDFQPLALQLEISRELDLTTSLEVCFSDIIKKQLEIVQSSLHFLIIDKYELLSIVNFLRNVFISGNGERTQEFINVAINQDSMLNLKYFSECLLFDTSLENIEKLQPSFYHSKNENRYNTEINIFQQNIQNYIGFQFNKMPVILEPYFSYIHLSKYMQIFNFIIRLKYSQKLITKSWKLLNNYKKQMEEEQREGADVEGELAILKKLYNVRYIINNFLNTFQSYMFLKIVEKQYKILRMNINNLHDLQTNHVKMLDNIIRFAFIDNPNQNISKNFRRNLTYINQFYQIVYQLTLDDIPAYRWQQTQEKIKLIYLNFKKETVYIENLILKLA